MDKQKKTWKNCISIVLALLLLAATSFNEVKLTANWIEPVLNENDTPLTDLKQTTLYYKFDNKGVWIKLDDIPASNRFGGKSVSHKFTIVLPNKQIEFIAFTATCWDFSGNESKYAKTVNYKIDKEAPNPPSYIEITVS